jgi:transcription initiation factor TFIIIB Brf1 subunit/transcription initiation factor TFIIB
MKLNDIVCNSLGCILRTEIVLIDSEVKTREPSGKDCEFVTIVLDLDITDIGVDVREYTEEGNRFRALFSMKRNPRSGKCR